jgi:hypothetical protein
MSVALAWLAAPAAAQNAPILQVGGGYSFLRPQDAGITLDGWNAALDGSVHGPLGLTAEISEHSKTLRVFDEKASGRLISFVAGPRVTPRARGVLRPFAHVLVGVAHASVDSFGDKMSVNGFLVQPGGGVDVMLMRSLSLRVGADARRLWFEGEGENQFRMNFGAVVPFGR